MWKLLILRAVDRIVRRQMHVGRIRQNRKFLWNVAVVFIRARCSLVGFAKKLRFLQRLASPDTSVHVSSARFREKVRRHHQELRAAAALTEKHLIILRNFH